MGSSRTAANVVGTVQGSLKSLVIDLAVLLEGHSPVSTLYANTAAADMASVADTECRYPNKGVPATLGPSSGMVSACR